MKLLRSIIAFFLFSLYFSLFAAQIHAQTEFSVDSSVTYDVQDSGKTLVTHDITLENNLSTVYATTYTLSFTNIDAQSVTARDVGGDIIPSEVHKDGDSTNVKVSFPKAVVGKGEKRHFFVSYTNASFAVKTGDIWEVSIPRLGDQNNFKSYRVILKIPASFGLEAYISPKPESANSDTAGKVYTFNEEAIKQAGISAGFGQFQVFSFNLSYHLENPTASSSRTQISLPPDTAFQKVFIQKIDPAPANVTVDPDGNWLATYILSARQRVDVVVSGSVQIFAGYRSFPKPSVEELGKNLLGTEYWQVDDPQIKALAQELKTPKAIYDYVSQTLKYDFNRVQPNVQRMGAVNALKSPDQAICMEFTDLFIAIARAAGIPAREINGYAYTENHDLQPLSLVADVLHAWPEYFDKTKGVWVPIDPTWAATSGGIDYFDKLDLRHFTFVIHGESDATPYAPGSYKLGPNPQKDVFVSFGKLPDARNSNLNISIAPKRTLPLLSSIYSVKISNPGPSAYYSLRPQVFFDNKEEAESAIEILPPYSNYAMLVNIPFKILGNGTPAVIQVKAGEASSQIRTNKDQVVIGSLLTISALLIIIIIATLFILKKITFAKIFATIGLTTQKIHAKFAKKAIKNTDQPPDIQSPS